MSDPGRVYTLEEITTKLTREAARAEGFGKTVKLDFGDEGLVRLDAAASPPAVSNQDGPADATLRTSLENFSRLARGELDPARAVFTRKLKISGDMGAAMGLAKLFRDAR